VTSRETTIDALAAAFLGITTSAGFHTNTNAVLRDDTLTEELSSTNPTYAIVDDGRDVPLQYAGDSRVRCAITLRVEAIYRDSYARTGSPSGIDAIVSDVRRLLHGAPDLGDYGLFARLLSIDDVDVLERGAVLRMTIVVHYWFDGSAP